MKPLLLLGALAAPFLAVAQTADNAPRATEPEPLVVTATRTPVAVTESLAAVTVIDREQIERSQATDIAEILRFEAGMDLGRTGGVGQQTAIFIRGGESNHTLVLIDGVRVNPATSGGAALQNIAPEMIERIEIVRGPRSTLYGSEAIGGVINIITRIAKTPEADIVLRGGSENQRDASASFGYGDGDKSLSLNLQQIRTDGIPSCAGSTLDRGYDNTSVNLRGSTKAGEKARLSARFWNAKGNTEYIDFCGAFGSPRDQDFQNQIGAIELSVDPLKGWTSTFTVSRAEDDIRQNQPNFLGALDSVRTRRPMLDWHNIVQVGSANRVSFGASAAREDVDAVSFGTVIEDKRDIYSGFLQDELSSGRHRFVAAVNVSDHEGFGTQVNGNAEYGFDLFSSTRLIAAAGTGFRAPDASDRFGFGGNPDLDPEKAVNYELGVKQTLGAHQTVDLRAFHSDVKDLISVECDVNFNCLAVNIDKYRNRGAELSWTYASAQWTAGLSSIVQKPENRETGDILPRRAKRSISGQVARHFGKHYVALDVLGSGKRPDVGGLENAGYALVNLSAGLQLDQRFRIQFRLENVLDKTYQTAAGYNQPDAGGYITLSYGL